jgi:ADP-ribose pyrophosphatase YjhB (NUDIX family)
VDDAGGGCSDDGVVPGELFQQSATRGLGEETRLRVGSFERCAWSEAR